VTARFVSTNDCRAGRVPVDAVGVEWQHQEWSECRRHIVESGAWYADDYNDDQLGLVVTDWDGFECDLCGGEEFEGLESYRSVGPGGEPFRE